MVKAYKEAYTLQRRVRNEEMWLQGIYICKALESVIGTAFGGKMIKYVQEPFNIYPKTKIEVEQEKLEQKQKLINYLNSLMIKNQ